MTASAADVEVRVYWRPWCPYCSRLRGDLARIGLPTRQINIWDDRDAAAVVRSVANGNETVPTVLVGGRDGTGTTAMVNPSATQVLEAVRSRAPGLLADVDLRAAGRAAHGEWWSGAVLALVMAVVWFGLAVASPVTTYHVAPLLTAAVWPLTRRWRVGTALPLTAALTAAVGGLLVGSATTLLLAERHVLAGPTLFGALGAWFDTLILVVLGAVLGGLAARWHRRAP